VVENREADAETFLRCTQIRAHYDLEHLVFAVLCRESGDVLIRHFVGVAVNFIHQRLEIGGHSRALRGCGSHVPLAQARSPKNCIENLVAELSVRVFNYAALLRCDPWRAQLQTIFAASRAGGYAW
jgi:hypothetical protein